MKRFFGLLGLFSVFLALEAGAHTNYISCSNGSFDDLGDGYFQIDILEDGIEFFPYEGSFSFDASEITYDSGTYAIVNKTTIASAEGEEYSSTVDAVLTLSEKGTKLNVAISHDKGPFYSYQMACVEK